MGILPGRLVVALDAGGVSGGLVSRGLRGTRLRQCARIPLPEGALLPRPLEANLPDRSAVVAALEELRARLRVNGRGATLILPDGPARLQLMDAGSESRSVDYARFRLGPTLPYAVGEAQVAILPLGGGRLLASAVRRAVVDEYEHAASSAGFVQRELSLSSYAALPRLLRSARSPAVAAVLGDTTVSLSAIGASSDVEAFRYRLRDAGHDEPERLWREAERTAGLAEFETFALVVVGAGASEVVSSLRAQGRAVSLGWDDEAGDAGAAAELAWLGLA
jgi:hypothetical protein